MHLRLYADGSSGAKSGQPIGWAWVIVDVATGRILYVGSGGYESGSNNVAELSGILQGLGRIHCGLSDFHGCTHLEVVSDSQYALGAASGLNAVHANAEMIEEIKMMVKHLRSVPPPWGGPPLTITFSWTPGHAGEPYQELCDRQAVRAKEKMKAALAAQALQEVQKA